MSLLSILVVAGVLGSLVPGIAAAQVGIYHSSAFSVPDMITDVNHVFS